MIKNYKMHVVHKVWFKKISGQFLALDHQMTILVLRSARLIPHYIRPKSSFDELEQKTDQIFS